MPLPAPYAPPWKRLGEDGVALVAWLGLKARELWRRNREGDLPVPAFWPRPWLRLFWPLLLVGALILAGALGRAWQAFPPGPGAAPVEQAERPGASPGEGREPEADDNPPPGAGPPRGAAAAGAAGVAPGGTESDAPSGSGSAGSTIPETPTLSEAPALPAPPPPGDGAASDGERPEEEASRLRALWSEEDRDPWIAAFLPDPAALTLTLRLQPSFAVLPASKRGQLAERWRQRAVAAGYSHLRLRDGQRRLLGRDALVGGGVVLFEPPGVRDDAP